MVQAIKAHLSADQVAQYQEELTKRAAGRKRLALRNLVARLDHDLVLSPDAREAQRIAVRPLGRILGPVPGDVPVRQQLLPPHHGSIRHAVPQRLPEEDLEECPEIPELLGRWASWEA